MRLVLVGPPGAGKGTQAQVIAGKIGVPAISTGDIFRANVSSGTTLGKLAKQYLDSGELVPDEVTVGMVADRLAQEDARTGFLLDGFPRTVPQAESLEQMLDKLSTPLDRVIELQVPDEEVIHRLSGRRTCRGCGRIWHVDYDPTLKPDICDNCGRELIQRDDDQPETISRRLEVYADQTSPLVDFYASRGLLVAIDAIGALEDVTRRALDALPSRDY